MIRPGSNSGLEAEKQSNIMIRLVYITQYTSRRRIFIHG